MASSRNKPVLIAWGIAVIVLAGFIWFNYSNGADGLDARDPEPSASVTNLVVTIGDRTFLMTNGVATAEPVAGSDTRETVRIIGEPALGDVNRDGHRDAALLIANDPGGIGTFYYAVLAVNDAGSYHATNALLVGDRAAPLTVDFLDGHFVYNYVDRRPGEPMTAGPSVRKSLWIRFDRAAGVISAGS
jgi:hypothetical protein